MSWLKWAAFFIGFICGAFRLFFIGEGGFGNLIWLERYPMDFVIFLVGPFSLIVTTLEAFRWLAVGG